MPAWTLDEARARLRMYQDAEERILQGNQEITASGTTHKRADLAEIRRGIERWRNEVERLESNTPRGPVFRTTRIVDPRRGY